MQKKVLIPIPSYGSDPTELSVPWGIMRENNIEITFATPDGKKAQSDTMMITGKGLGIWKSVLRAKSDVVAIYKKLEKDNAFCNPISYKEMKMSDFDGIFFPGGHDKAIKEYLESEIVQQVVVDFFNEEKPVGAICHGVIVVARSIDPKTQKSVLFDFKTTSLLKKQEMLAYNLTKWKLKDYYLTYPGLPVEDEVKAVLSNEKNFIQGPMPIFRDSKNNLRSGFVVKDRNYLSARWPGDAHKFSMEFVKMIKI